MPDWKEVAPNKLMTQKREIEIIDRILQGERRVEIEDFLMNEYHLALYSAKIAYYKARKKIKELRKENVDEMTNTHILRYEELYKRAKKEKWNKLAMQILRQKENMLQLDNERTLKVHVDNKTIHLDAQYIVDPEEKLEEDNKIRLFELLDKVEHKKKTSGRK